MSYPYPLIESLESRALLSTTPATGVVRGGVYIDQNLNGLHDSGDSTLQPFAQAYLDVNHNGLCESDEPRSRVRPDGHYHIDNVLPGRYLLRVTVFSHASLQGGYAMELPSGSTVRVHGGQIETRWLSLIPPATSTGTFFVDDNGDGVKQPNEAPLSSGRPQPLIYVDFDNLGHPVGYRHRPANQGVYLINSIPPGTYHLRVQRGPYHFTTPLDVLLTFKPGETLTHNFGVRPPLPS